MGKPKTPTNILKLKGADKVHPERMKKRKHEPNPARGIAKVPIWLSRRGRRIFRDLAKITASMDVLTVSDNYALAMLADAYDDYFAASEAIEAHGATYVVITRDDVELVKNNPAVHHKNEAWRRINVGLGKFGLDPSSRAGLIVNNPDEENEFDVPEPYTGERKLIPGTRISVRADDPRVSGSDDDEF